jgi:inactivated superfamily I helicase
MKTDWIEVDSEQLAMLRESTDPNTAEFRSLYTAAPAAVLPGEVEELSMLIRRLVHSLKNSNPNSGLLWSVPDYMHRKGYWKENGCLRGDDD